MIILLSILSGIFGRMGGSSNYNSNWRDFGINILHILFFLCVVGWTPWLIVYVGLFKASVSTYWDFLFHGEDNFWMHGFMLGLSAFVICFITGHWWLMLGRSIILSLFMGVWHVRHPKSVTIKQYRFDGAEVEEFGRYAMLTFTLPMIV